MTQAQTFQQIWRPGRRVRERVRPFRKGTIIRRIRTGNNALIFVALDGGHAAIFSPGQLTLL